MKKVLCMVLCVCLLLMPVKSYAQETEIETETEEWFETDGVNYTAYTTDNQVIVKFENTNDEVAFISKTNISFYNDAGELIDTETMEAVFVDAGSVNYGEITYHEEYASIKITPYVYLDNDTQFDYNDGFVTTEAYDEFYAELYITITNVGDKEASVMLTVVYYKDDEIFYVAPDIGETWLYAGDSEEVTTDLPQDENYNFLEYDSYEIIIMGYSLE
ncbi:MAG: hypothetical protein LIP12_00210 [Clostridiales bacterium]|nr:hypothetical protein [Clostridiales bacterium]